MPVGPPGVPMGRRSSIGATKNGNQDVWVIDVDGSNKKRLTDHPALDGDAQWSPDGKKIVFVSERTGKGDLYLMEADGSNQKRLTSTEALDWTPYWSPDGKTIAYVSNQTKNFEIWTLNLETLEAKHLTPNTCGSFVPRWRADGTRISCVTWRGGEYTIKGSFDLAIMNIDGSEKKDSAPSPTMSDRPDGARMAAASSSGPGGPEIRKSSW